MEVTSKLCALAAVNHFYKWLIIPLLLEEHLNQMFRFIKNDFNRTFFISHEHNFYSRWKTSLINNWIQQKSELLHVHCIDFPGESYYYLDTTQFKYQWII